MRFGGSPVPSFARVVTGVALAWLFAAPAFASERVQMIGQVKRSVVAIGTFERTRSPQFEFRGTGFAVADGSIIATNAHVLPPVPEAGRPQTIAIATPGPAGTTHVREVQRLAVDAGVDLALLKLSGAPLPPLAIGDSDSTKEGQDVLFTGFPLGPILGPFAATHRGMISAITPIAIPQGRAAQLDPAVIRRLASGAFPVFQLDATAYPGNSGSPVYEPDTGRVIGIVNMVFVKGTKETAITHPSGIAYAVPASHLAELLRSLKQDPAGK